MKLVILLALAGLALAGPILTNSQQDVRILSDGSIIVSNGMGTRVFIQKSTESKGNVEIVIKNSNGFIRVIEISSPNQVVKDVVKNSANVEITASVISNKPVDSKKDKSKGPVVNGEVQLKTLQTIVREFQGIIDAITYIELLNKISTAVNNGELNKVILEALRSITDDQQQIQLVEDVNNEEVESIHQQAVPFQPSNQLDYWNQYQAQNGPWPAQTQSNPWSPAQSWYQTSPPYSPTFGAQNNFKVKFGPGGPFGPFGPFSPFAPAWWNSSMAGAVNPWVANNPWLQSNPWVANNPWVSPNAAAVAGAAPNQVVPQTQTQTQSPASSFGEQNNFAVKFGALTPPWWFPTSPIDVQIKEAVKYQKNALKNLQQLQQLKLAQSTAAAQGTGSPDGSAPSINYDSAIQSAQEVLQFAQKNVADLALQKQQQQLALQFGTQPTGQPAAAVEQQPATPDVTQSFYVNQDTNESANAPESAVPHQSEIVPNFFTSFKVKPTKAPKQSTIAEAPPIAQTKVAAVIQQRIQAIQDQWNQQNLVNQQLLQQQAQVSQQLKQLQDQIQVARAQGASPELLNQLQLVQQDLSNRQMLLIQQQVNQQAITNGLHAQLAILNDQMKNVPEANIPEGASSWPQILGIPTGASKQGGTITRVPLQGGLQNFSPV